MPLRGLIKYVIPDRGITAMRHMYSERPMH